MDISFLLLLYQARIEHQLFFCVLCVVKRKPEYITIEITNNDTKNPKIKLYFNAEVVPINTPIKRLIISQ